MPVSRISPPTFLRSVLARRALPLAGAALGLAALAGAADAQVRNDLRTNLRAGYQDAGEAAWNLRVVSRTPTAAPLARGVNSDLAFTGNLVVQGNFSGWMIWDVSQPKRPQLVRVTVCPGSQSDVSVYRNLLFVSSEDFDGRLDCGTQGVRDTISGHRMRGIRVFDIRDPRNPRNVANVQTCRGSHTHTLVEDPRDTSSVLVYVAGSSPVRPEAELAGCVGKSPEEDPRSALFRLEVIRVPLANPERAAIVSTPRVFDGLAPPPVHGETPADVAAAAREAEAARRRGAFTVRAQGLEQVVSPAFARPLLDSIVRARGGTGAPTAADSAALRGAIQGIVDGLLGTDAPTGPTQCHDITVFPAAGLAAGACEGYGMLLDIRDPVNPRRLTAVADSNFAYWHSATFSNDGRRVLFTDEWGGGPGAKCRITDPVEWGADAIFTVTDARELRFESYYKLPGAQSPLEGCVAHNGSLIPIPGRDVMVQSWYQGGVSVVDFTDPAKPVEIAYFDRGPMSATEPSFGGTWSAYWYNGLIYSSETARGLDVLELVPGPHLTRNEIEAAASVRLPYLNVQSQPRHEWPATFALARAYVDQLARSKGLPEARISAVRQALDGAERAEGAARATALTRLAAGLEAEAARSTDGAKVRTLAATARALAAAR